MVALVGRQSPTVLRPILGYNRPLDPRLERVDSLAMGGRDKPLCAPSKTVRGRSASKFGRKEWRRYGKGIGPDTKSLHDLGADLEAVRVSESRLLYKQRYCDTCDILSFFLTTTYLLHSIR